MMQTIYFLDRDLALEGRLYCLGLENYQGILPTESRDFKELYPNSVYYIGEHFFEGYPIVDGDTVRPATDKELIDLGFKELMTGEVLENDMIKTVPYPNYDFYTAYEWDGAKWNLNTSKIKEGYVHIGDNQFEKVEVPQDIIKPKWVYPQWVESATELDVAEYNLNQYLALNNYLDGEEMKEKGIFEDYKSYINELKIFIKSRKGAVLDLGLHDKFTIIPQPSVALMNFYNSKVEE